MIRFVSAWTLAVAAACAGCCAPGVPVEAPAQRTLACALGERPSVNDLLYFGLTTPTGTVTQAEWDAFLRDVVTPRFPAGLSAWPAAGQWLDRNGVVTHEASFVLDLVHADDVDSEKSIQALVADYKQRFAQEAVLRVRTPACVSF